MAEDQEVDVQLFITCRLCLDEPGLYQIVPLIKGHINYCFGIDIDPFDGLPQLICKKCKCILNEYHAIKNTFEDKQNQLRKRALKHNKVARSVDLTAVEDEKSAATEDEKPAPADAVRHGNQATSPDATDVAPNARTKRKRASWKKAYNEHFVCTICSKSYLTEKSVKKHMTVHKTIMGRHEKVFKKCLTIQMNRIDKKKNVTGRIQHVVYDKNKIISKRVTSNYYSFYLKRGFKENNKTDENENVAIKEPVRKSEGKRRLSESSDEVFIKGMKRKTRRLFSISSTQTVVLDVSKEEECVATVDSTQTDKPKTGNETETAEAECIHIDDTSSDCPKPELNNVRVVPPREQAKAKVGDYKAIQSIVTMCHKNYIKKVQSETSALNDKPTFSESSLKHKVLSLGRKVINKQGFSCTGILRYMEHKDLGITWKPTSVAMQSKGSNYVRIMTKLKSREDSENEDAGWKNINDISLFRDSDKENNICVKLTKEIETIASESVIPLQPEDPSSANACETSDLNSTNKGSCKTPVPTSKQTIIVKPIIKPTEVAEVPQTVESEDPEVSTDSNMLMPIITSTTSLSQGRQMVTVSGVPVARIKVKPASELMSERALSNQEASEDIWAFNVRQSSSPQLFVDIVDPGPSTSGLQNGFIPDESEISVLLSNQTATQSATVETNRIRNQNLASVILNSPELPNTKTESPFHYFRTLLLFHGLQLLELNEELTDDFHCLVRFKLLLKQHTKKTITVLFSLFCSNNKFCFTFKDAYFKKFDPNKLPGFWQWELLKVYKGTVVDKILLNASTLGKEVHEFTKHFLCLLKSIDLVPES